MVAYAISSFGLALDLIGVILIWRYGFVADLAQRGGAIVTHGFKADPRARPGSLVAFVCLVGGFGLQLAANLMQMWAQWSGPV